MALCNLTSHVEISTTDRVVGGRTIKAGQSIIVSDQQVGGGAGTGQVDVCKVSQYVEGLLECVPVTDDLSGITGTDGAVIDGQPLFISDTANFINNAVAIGDRLIISSGNQQGTFTIVQIQSNAAVQLTDLFDEDENVLSWSLVRNERPPDYSQVIRALPVSDDALLPQLRYFPLFGPGDYFGNEMSAHEPSGSVSSPGANFNDPLRPIPTDSTGYLELLSGTDIGFHRITAIGANSLLVDGITVTEANLKFRVRLVSPHATHVVVSDWGSDKVAIPIQDSFPIKIVRAIRNLEDAQAADAQTEIPGQTRAVDLFTQLGAYIGCYRQQRVVSQATGSPLDQRVLIPAMPWWGHDVDGELFFKQGGQQKYTLVVQNPVIPIRWTGYSYRLEMAVARETAQQPTPGEECI